ncbi:sel1 repeat family protein [Candidatus Methylacidiphilum infernorum]|uniref:Sel1 repeat family protein n=2 Tax=Candidatus Methylacidiphilum infernorum TaxID=511746 RepID=A0ABX7PYI7_9BACT|nr:sel1 repeat family protein [Candidatus Methylacidiphilum infernorum]
MTMEIRAESISITQLEQRARGGNAQAQLDLGDAYSRGQGVTKDLAQAVYWYRKAAEQGNVQAQYKLGFAYYWGVGGFQRILTRRFIDLEKQLSRGIPYPNLLWDVSIRLG